MVHRRVASACLCEHTGARVPLIEGVRVAESLRKLTQSSDPQKNMDQLRGRRKCRTNNLQTTDLEMLQFSSIEDSHLPNNAYNAHSHFPYLRS